MAEQTDQNNISSNKSQSLPSMEEHAKDPQSDLAARAGDDGSRIPTLKYECVHCGAGLVEPYCRFCNTDKWIIDLEPDSIPDTQD